MKRILVAKRTKIPELSWDDLGVTAEDLNKSSGVELVKIEEPEIEEREVIKIEEDDLEVAVDKLLNKLKEAGVDIGAYR